MALYRCMNKGESDPGVVIGEHYFGTSVEVVNLGFRPKFLFIREFATNGSVTGVWIYDSVNAPGKIAYAYGSGTTTEVNLPLTASGTVEDIFDNGFRLNKVTNLQAGKMKVMYYAVKP